MVTKKAIPEKDLLPAIPDSPTDNPDYMLVKNARESLNTLHGNIRAYSKDRSRIRHLISFKDRHYTVNTSEGAEPKIAAMSQVRQGDRPEIELYLKHRDKVTDLDAVIEKTKERLAKVDISAGGDNELLQTIHNIMGKLDRLEEKSHRHMTAMEDILDRLSKEQDRGAIIMAKLASDTAKLAQSATQHMDKMEIERDKHSDTSDSDLLKKLAAKHGVTLEQMQALLDAKTVETEPDDAG